MHPPASQQQMREEQLRKEEARREEEMRKTLESQLSSFDAYSFYEELQKWSIQKVPEPIEENVYITPIRKEKVFQQVLPVSRKDLKDIRLLSSSCARLLYLLRAIDQHGIECPYIYTQKQAIIEHALDRCKLLQKASLEYVKTSGLWNSLFRLLQKAHLSEAQKELEFFKNRLEAVYILCHQQEFVLDLQKMRGRSVLQERFEYGNSPVPMDMPSVKTSVTIRPKNLSSQYKKERS